MFEVEHLRYATLATVSRCGMIWFSEDVVVPDMMYDHYLQTLCSIPLDEDDENSDSRGPSATADTSPLLPIQRAVATNLEPFFQPNGLVSSALEHTGSIEHIMDFTATRALNTLFSLLNKTVRNVIDYNNTHSDFPLVPRYWNNMSLNECLLASYGLSWEMHA